MDANSALVPTDPFGEMEKADEQMVLDEIKGRAIESLVYEINERGQTVTGLSLAGVRETARSMNKNSQARIAISDREPIIIETDDYIEVKVYALDTQNGGGYWGIKRQPKHTSGGKVNHFALEQALAKAQRNALRGLIPEWFIKEMIDAWRQRGNVKTISHEKKDPREQMLAFWQKRTALRLQIGLIPHYSDSEQHVLNALVKLTAEGSLNSKMTDDEVFDVVNAQVEDKTEEKQPVESVVEP